MPRAVFLAFRKSFDGQVVLTNSLLLKISFESEDRL
jgi:hypothetical protein